MPELIERLRWNRDQIETSQRQQLRALLACAIENSPFHRRRLSNLDPGRFDLPDLPGLPVMSKAEMMESLDDVFTDRRLNRGLVEQALAATASEPVPILGRYTALVSGGSSGRRGVFIYDLEGTLGATASQTRSLMARLPALGGPVPPVMTIGLVAAGSPVHGSGSTIAWTAGNATPISITSIPATFPFPEIVERLHELQPRVLAGYPSMLARLATEQRAGSLRVAPTFVNSAGETLLPEMRVAIAEAFSAPIVDTFTSSEGLAGTTAPDDDILVFNSDLCIVELVDADNRPVPPGVASAKLLITNLYNRTQPLIRYELGDSFVRQPDAPDHGHLRAKVRGRAEDMLHYGGVDIHPHVIRSALVKSPEILDYRIRQTRRGIDVEALAAVPVNSDRLADHLVQALAAAGLHDPAVSVRIVDDLERIPDTGKLRRFLPLP
jgi:phenylacetate-coenzyme A ligase PaaK-like adenylate-forming protein